MATDFVRCDDEFSEIGEDLDMTDFGTAPVGYVPPDITRELAMLEQYAQKREKMAKAGPKTIATCSEG